MFDDSTKDKVKEYNIRFREKEEDPWKAAIVKPDKTSDGIIEGQVDNLNPKTSYIVCIVAVLRDGTSLTSKEITVKTLIEGIASQVIEPSVTRVDKTSCVVKWRAINDKKAKYRVEHDDGTRGTIWKEYQGEIEKKEVISM